VLYGIALHIMFHLFGIGSSQGIHGMQTSHAAFFDSVEVEINGKIWDCNCGSFLSLIVIMPGA